MDPALKSALPDTYRRRMSPAQARLALAQLSRVDADTEIRLGYAERYAEGLHGLRDVVLPPRRRDGSHIYLTYPIQVPDREALNRYLMSQCQDVTIQHLINNAEAPCFSPWHRTCPNAARTARSVLLLPTYPSYGWRNVDRNVKLIRRFYS